jgi:hypothetical protein
VASDSNASDGFATGLSDGETASFNFDAGYDVPESDTNIAIRVKGNGFDTPTHRYSLNGANLGTYSPSTGGSYTWKTDLRSVATNSPDVQIEEGTNTFSIEVIDSGSDTFFLDVIAPYDEGDRFGGFSYTFDNDNGGSDGYLNGPQFYPAVFTQSLATASTRRDVTQANFELTANNVSNNFYVELANDGSTFTRVNNSQTGSVTFSSGEKNIDVNIGLSRYGSRTSATPQTGFNGQSVDVFDLFANPDAVITDNIGATVTRAVVSPNTIDGTTIREAGLKSGSTLLTRHRLAEFTVLADQRLSSSETTKFTSDN